MKVLCACRRVLVFVVALLTAQRAGAQLTDWATLLGGAGSEVGYSVATDFDGSVVVAGSFDGNTMIGDAHVASAGLTDVFVAKFSGGGALMWVKRLGGVSPDQPAQAAIDKETGDVVVTGRFATVATVDHQVLRSAGSNDVFVARFSKSGVLQWTRTLGGVGDDLAAGVAVDPSGSSLVAGQFSGTLTCGPTTLTSVGGTDIFVANIAIDGALRWCRRYGGAFDDTVDGIAAGDTGLFALTGAFGATTDFGGGRLSSVGSFDAYVAAYAVTDGDFWWARRMGGSGYDGGNAVAFDPAGAVVVTGYLGSVGGDVDFGGAVLATQGGADAFVAKYNGSDGTSVWARAFGGTLDDYANAVTVDGGGDIIVVGEFQGLVRFAGISNESGGQFDAFVARFSSSGEPLWWRSYGDLINDKAYGVAVDFEGNLFVTGFSIFRIDLGEGDLYSAGMSDAFLAKLAPAIPYTATPTRTFTPTSIPPTRTFTPTIVPPTRTFTPTIVPPTRTFTPTIVPPTRTFTPTSIPPTRTFTPTIVPPTRTFMPTIVPPTRTFTPTIVPPAATRTFTPRPPPASTPTSTVAAPGCTFDCNADGAVSVSELISGINIVLGQAEFSTCDIADANNDGTVTIDEVVTAVRSLLNGCP